MIKQMSIGDIIKELGITGLGYPWNQKEDLIPDDFNTEMLFFLKKEFLDEANNYIKFPEQLLELLKDTARLVQENMLLSRFAQHCVNKLYRAGEIDVSRCTEIPEINALGEHRGMFSILVLLAGMPELLSLYEKKGIPEYIALDTLSDLKLWTEHYYRTNGIYGLVELHWLIKHLFGKLYRLGRLQYEMTRFDGNLKVYRNKENRKVIALSEGSIPYRGDGFADGTNGITDKENGWISEFDVSKGKVCGYPVIPSGLAVRKKVELDLEKWELVLENGDNILFVHIPEGSKMDHEQCGKSFEMAIDFFPRYYKNFDFRGFMCVSWLLDPQLQNILSDSTNIVKFQREFYLYPLKSDDSQLFERVFGSKPSDIENLPEGNSLQKAIKKHYLNGGFLHTGGMFLLKDDLNWGNAVYQKGSSH